MSPGQLDYDIPAELVPSAGTLLAAFETFVSDAGLQVGIQLSLNPQMCFSASKSCPPSHPFWKLDLIEVWRRDKEPGGHLTPFWLQARMSTRAPSASVVQFGCTAFAEVNAAPHMYVRAKGPGA